MVGENTTQTPLPIYQAIIGRRGGGGTADFIMHGLDTVKTRLQGQSHPPKYLSLRHTFSTILREEGVLRGLYGGIQPAIVGSVGGTMIYFGAYEALKRTLDQGISIPNNLNPFFNSDTNSSLFRPPSTITHLTSAGLAEVLVSVIYVPSEVLKTRMQLQGKYNNPHFDSGYNYTSWTSALRTIIKNDGIRSIYRGYQATLLRDVPCTAIQFAIYEKLQSLYHETKTENNSSNCRVETSSLDFVSDMTIGGLAGAIAGGITTPLAHIPYKLDVVKTVLQTQKVPQESRRSQPKSTSDSSLLGLPKVPHAPSTLTQKILSLSKLPPGGPERAPYTTGIWDGLVQSYRSYGVGGLFRGLAPRVVWMGFQSAILFVIYEQVLSMFPKKLKDNALIGFD